MVYCIIMKCSDQRDYTHLIVQALSLLKEYVAQYNSAWSYFAIFYILEIFILNYTTRTKISKDLRDKNKIVTLLFSREHCLTKIFVRKHVTDSLWAGLAPPHNPGTFKWVRSPATAATLLMKGACSGTPGSLAPSTATIIQVSAMINSLSSCLMWLTTDYCDLTYRITGVSETFLVLDHSMDNVTL